MIFRSSTFVLVNQTLENQPLASYADWSKAHPFIWYEAHPFHDKFVVARLSGHPLKLRPSINWFFWRAARETDRPRTLPKSAHIRHTANTVEEALEELIRLESWLPVTLKMADCGDINRPKVPHYVDLMLDEKLPTMPLPEFTWKAAEELHTKSEHAFLFLGMPERMFDASRNAFHRLRTLPIAHP